jgi:hypothetical protein
VGSVYLRWNQRPSSLATCVGCYLKNRMLSKKQNHLQNHCCWTEIHNDENISKDVNSRLRFLIDMDVSPTRRYGSSAVSSQPSV